MKDLNVMILVHWTSTLCVFFLLSGKKNGNGTIDKLLELGYMGLKVTGSPALPLFMNLSKSLSHPDPHH